MKVLVTNFLSKFNRKPVSEEEVKYLDTLNDQILCWKSSMANKVF